MTTPTLKVGAVLDNPSLRWSKPVFDPAPGLGHPHSQTIVGKWLRSSVRCATRRERLETPDGDFLDLDIGVAPLPADAPVVVLLHGLGGSAYSGYMRQTCRELSAHGLRPVAMNFRSCSGETNRRVRSYHSGETGDLAHVLGVFAQRYPRAPLAAVGFSLGGNVLLKYLAEKGTTALLRTAVAVSVPFDLAACSAALEKGAARLYGWRFLVMLKRSLRAKAELFPGAYDLDGGLGARTVRDFDHTVTAPIHGFDSADDYYARSSSAAVLERISVPTLLVQARDDPFVPVDSVPLAAIGANPALDLVLTERGGHLGFVGRESGSVMHFWCERQAARYVATRLAPEGHQPGDRYPVARA